ncbi:hypothetical protein BJ322DRAFT_525814 [Thelephora terrestris]|uniref:Uncharacterized protein n=1 Tax=Thelephora terrestris TaxID=56493 RepID=A0A9P6HKW5_9AGAM|nr:hypothetical protein BJ322DRAFT_525814 [Thelephora terrestris]
MECLRYGHALWEPTPTSKYNRISIGDVGFIRQGRFHLLFSAALPLGKRKPGVDVPNTFEQLRVGTTEPGGPRPAGCVAARTSRRGQASAENTETTVLPLLPGTDFTYEGTGNSGAALITRHSTYNEDSQLDSEFRQYTKRHYKSWITFAKEKKYGTNLRPVLVSGFDMAKDFAMMAYHNMDPSAQARTTIATPMFGSATGSGSWVWRTTCSPHVKHGPQELLPPDMQSLPSGSKSAQSPSKSPSTEFNQCVFVRYYTMREGFFPKVIRATAGPHELGSGDNKGDYFPELVTQSEPEAMSGDEERRDAGSGSDMDEGPDSWDAIADYVFQNSKAKRVLLHHQDLAGLRAVGCLALVIYRFSHLSSWDLRATWHLC